MSRLLLHVLIGLLLTVILGLGAFPLLRTLTQPPPSRATAVAAQPPPARGNAYQRKKATPPPEVEPRSTHDKPFPPAEAARHMTVPPGFKVTLFAGEPDLVQPIAFTFDDRGRLWVAECLSYPNWLPEGAEGRDRILIFEDRDGDGRFDTCKVFCDKLANVTGLEVGFGGVWVCSTPHLLFIPDRDRDDKPDGPPEVVLDGWDLHGQHNVLNGLAWGLDGWLYGCSGNLSHSRVGKPGTPDNERAFLSAGIWRYHPVRRQFEVVAHGTTNPWGIDFDDYGQMFTTNCCNKHLWHVIPGAHYQRLFGQDPNPYSFGLMESPADHIHWAGGHYTTSIGGKGKHSDMGGGHAHCGCMVYLGDNWPDSYRNHVFMCNIHGNRVNQDILERRGSGYVAHHGRDFLFAHDPWFRGIALHYGPDGGVFVADWTDTGECHNFYQVDRSNGRIYKVTYGKPTPWRGDVAVLSDRDLVASLMHKNDWHAQHARRVLQERAAAHTLDPETHALLWKMLEDNADITRKLRALWALQASGGLNEQRLIALTKHAHEAVRAWAVQFMLDRRDASAGLRQRLAEMAAKDDSPFVRLYVASGLQRLPEEERWPIAIGLACHGEDGQDINLTLMLWYGIEQAVHRDPERALDLLQKANIPLIREYIARRLADPAKLLPVLAADTNGALQRDVLRGLQAALEGLGQSPMPDGWLKVFAKLCRSPDSEVRGRALALSSLFGDRQALESLQKVVMDAHAAVADRQEALQTLVSLSDPALLPLLQTLLSDRAMRGGALRALAVYADDATPDLILRHYKSFTAAEKSDAVQTLASRPAYALALLNAVKQGRVLRRDVSAFTARQLRALQNPQVDVALARVWGTVRPASQEKAQLMARYTKLLTGDSVARSDRGRGRLVFKQTCATCHRLFDDGGDIGPELTGAQRTNLDYILENVLDPSAVVARDYQVSIIETRNGRVITGIIKQENDKALTLQTQNEKVTLPKHEIKTRSKSPISMMPEGMLAKLTDEEARDLVAYLASPEQAPLPGTRP
ncbi:MAG TPA: PVC-type heme-binding CxxCH protein [Gemmataceae bacterium]|nr:PVC-type heme-binding CxxCH protein [Gemmataceae bacterium]